MAEPKALPPGRTRAQELLEEILRTGRKVDLPEPPPPPIARQYPTVAAMGSGPQRRISEKADRYVQDILERSRARHTDEWRLRATLRVMESTTASTVPPEADDSYDRFATAQLAAMRALAVTLNYKTQPQRATAFTVLQDVAQSTRLIPLRRIARRLGVTETSLPSHLALDVAQALVREQTAKES